MKCEAVGVCESVLISLHGATEYRLIKMFGTSCRFGAG